jgi:hypothetical protein
MLRGFEASAARDEMAYHDVSNPNDEKRLNGSDRPLT